MSLEERDIMEEFYASSMAQLQSDVRDLVGLMNVMMHDITESDLEIVKWRQTLIRYLPRHSGQMLDLDLLDLLNSGRYSGYEGYHTFLDYGGQDPSSSSEFRCRLHRMRKGIEADSERYTYSISKRGGYKMYCEAVGRLRRCLCGAVRDDVLEDPEPLWQELDELVRAYDAENRATHAVNEAYNKALDEAEDAVRHLRDEVGFLYEQLYTNKVRIPLDGHSVSLEPFAHISDPNREDYGSDYSLPSRYFNLDG